MLESLFNKVADIEACNVIKKRLQHRCFSMNIAKFLGTPILKNICERMLLKITRYTGTKWIILLITFSLLFYSDTSLTHLFLTSSLNLQIVKQSTLQMIYWH